MHKVEKEGEKQLTNRGQYGNLTKLSGTKARRAGTKGRTDLKSLRNFRKKYLTSQSERVKIAELICGTGKSGKSAKRNPKRFQKSA